MGIFDNLFGKKAKKDDHHGHDHGEHGHDHAHDGHDHHGHSHPKPKK